MIGPWLQPRPLATKSSAVTSQMYHSNVQQLSDNPAKETHKQCTCMDPNDSCHEFSYWWRCFVSLLGGGNGCLHIHSVFGLGGRLIKKCFLLCQLLLGIQCKVSNAWQRGGDRASYDNFVVTCVILGTNLWPSWRQFNRPWNVLSVLRSETSRSWRQQSA